MPGDINIVLAPGAPPTRPGLFWPPFSRKADVLVMCDTGQGPTPAHVILKEPLSEGSVRSDRTGHARVPRKWIGRDVQFWTPNNERFIHQRILDNPTEGVIRVMLENPTNRKGEWWA